MERLHSISFILGIVCGAVVCILGFLMVSTVHPHPQIRNNNAQAINGNWNTGNRQDMVKRMAERLGMTEEDLTKELTSGKSMMQIVSEHQKDASTSSSSTSVKVNAVAK